MLLLLTTAVNSEKGLCQAGNIESLSKNVVQIVTDSSKGSGVVVPINKQLFIFTNRHIVEGNYQFIINVLTDLNEPAEPKFIANLVGYSSSHDFAILEITTYLDGKSLKKSNYICGTRSNHFCFVEMNFPDHNNFVKRGDSIGLLGFPAIGKNELIYSTGIISSLKYEVFNDRRLLVWLRTDAQMSPGNSGGLAFNSNGIPLGLPTYVRTESQTGGRLGNVLSFDLIFHLIKNGGLIGSWDNHAENQTSLDFRQEPQFGETSLNPGLKPNLFQTNIIAGGRYSVNHMGNECIGFAAIKPDFRLHLRGDTDRLLILFIADNDGDDATLIINTPDGNWHCNDDAYYGTLNPAISFAAPLTGQYDIWVGSYHEGELIEGNLVIKEITDTDNQTAKTIDWSLMPHFGTASLTSGFSPDPYSVFISAGGNIRVSEANYGSDCIGHVDEAPDFRLQWSGNSTRLIFSFVANNPNDDATLLINAPDGSWHCNDDAHMNTRNPQVIFRNPSQGQYDIWVGNYRNVDLIRGRLLISEIYDTVL